MVLKQSVAAWGSCLWTVTNPANGHSYYLLSSNTWTASQAEAAALGGNLPINDAAENDWVFDISAQDSGTCGSAY